MPQLVTVPFHGDIAANQVKAEARPLVLLYQRECHEALSRRFFGASPVAAPAVHSKFDMTLQVYAHPVIPVSRRHEAMDRMAAALLPAAGEAGKGTCLTLTR